MFGEGLITFKTILKGKAKKVKFLYRCIKMTIIKVQFTI